MEASDFYPKDFNDRFKRVREKMTRVYQAVLTCREYGLDYGPKGTQKEGKTTLNPGPSQLPRRQKGRETSA